VLDQLYAALQDAVRAAAQKKFGLALDAVPLEKPPQVALGDVACPLPFELARRLKRSPRQIAQELGLSTGDVQHMTEPLRTGVVAAQPEPSLSGQVEGDAV